MRKHLSVSAVAVLCICMVALFFYQAPLSSPGDDTTTGRTPEIAVYTVAGDPAPVGITAVISAAVAAAQTDDSDEDEEEEAPTTIPTLEREAPPRPEATMARAHQYHHRPLVQSDHQLITPASPFTPDENETDAPPLAVVPRDGLVIQGIGVLLGQTPEDVALTRNGVEIANLEWLLDPAMHLGGRHPRVAIEGGTFTVTVTAEARNVSIEDRNQACVVLMPPPTATGVYEITRTREPQRLLEGERGVWEFSVVTRTGRLMLANLTLPEERLVTNLTSNPDLFAFRAYSFTDGQEILSTGLSDPVIAIRPSEANGAAAEEDSSLPGLYTHAGIQNSTLHPSETIIGAWKRGIDHEMIVAEAAEHYNALENLGIGEVRVLHTEEEMSGHENGVEGQHRPTSTSSPFDLIASIFQGLFGWIG